MWLTADSYRGSEKRREDKYHLGTFAPFCVAQGWSPPPPPLHLGKACFPTGSGGKGTGIMCSGIETVCMSWWDLVNR